MSGKIGVGIVGAGWAGGMAADAYAKVPEAEVKVIVDVKEECAKKLAETYRCEWSTDYDKVLERYDITVIDVCTPPFTHCELAVKAAEAGKHVCVQKPFALSLEDCDKVINAAKKNNVKLILQHMMRFSEPMVKVYELIKKGTIGEPEITYFRQVITAEFANKPWLTDPEMSGGQLIEYNVHGYDLLRWYHGEVDRVYAEIAQLHPLLRNTKLKDDHSVVALRFKNGSLGVVEGSWSGTSTTSINSIQTIGTMGTIEIELSGFAVPRFYTWRVYEIEGPIKTWVSASMGFVERAAYFIECIREDEPVTRATGLDGRKDVEIGLAARKSAETHMPVKLPL